MEIRFQSLNWLETTCGLRFEYESSCSPMVTVYKDGERIAGYNTNSLVIAVNEHQSEKELLAQEEE
jgi:hypothetical protein